MTVVLTWSSFCLCWYTDWVGEQSLFHNSGSYLIYILSCWYTDWAGEPSEQSFITVVLTWSSYCLCWFTAWVGEPSAFHNISSYFISISCLLIHWLGWETIRVSLQWFLLDLHIVMLIHWLGCRTVRASSQWFLLDLHIVCVDTLIGLEKPQSFITMVLYRSGSTYCLCWYTDWVGERSAFHNSGSYLICISSVSIHWLGWRSLRV